MSIGRDHRARDPVEVIALAEPLAAGTMPALLGRCEPALVDGGVVVIDLRAAPTIDTQTLSELCAVLREISRHGAKLVVVGADPRVQWVLALCEIPGLEVHPG